MHSLNARLASKASTLYLGLQQIHTFNPTKWSFHLLNTDVKPFLYSCRLAKLNFPDLASEPTDDELRARLSGTFRKNFSSSSKYTGVFWNAAREKWNSYIYSKGCKTHLGTFPSEEEAAMAYDRAAMELFGRLVRGVRLFYDIA
jgi:hypothetical protein